MNRTEHLLACLAEECAEVQHAVAKALRFGLDDGYPGAASTNAQDIAREFVDVLAVVEMLEETGALKRPTDTHAIERKKARIDELLVTIGANAKMYANEANDRIYRHQAELASAKARIAELEAKLEQERMRLTACGVVAMAYEEAYWNQMYANACDQSASSVVWRPKLFIDGNQWCALYGDNIQDGVAGFGDTPDKAMRDFDLQWRSQTIRRMAKGEK